MRLIPDIEFRRYIPIFILGGLLFLFHHFEVNIFWAMLGISLLALAGIIWYVRTEYKKLPQQNLTPAPKESPKPLRPPTALVPFRAPDTQVTVAEPSSEQTPNTSQQKGKPEEGNTLRDLFGEIK